MIEFSGIRWFQTFSHQLRSPSALTSCWPSLPSPLTFNPYLISSPHHFLSSTSQMVVAGFSAHTDLSKAQEIRNEVHRVTRNLKECQALSQTYNQRERLFGMPVTQVGVGEGVVTGVGKWGSHRGVGEGCGCTGGGGEGCGHTEGVGEECGHTVGGGAAQVEVGMHI